MKQKFQISFLVLASAAAVILTSCGVTEKSVYNFATPNVMVDDTVYWFCASYENFTLPDSFVLIGTTIISDTQRAEENFSAHGVANGAEIYQSNEYPGWVYIRWDKYWNLFTVSELGLPLLKFNDALYVSVNAFNSSVEADARIDPPRFTKSYVYQGNLIFGEVGAVPLREFETNSTIYQFGKLYYNEEESSTVYFEFPSDGTNSSYHAFYDVSLIPLDYSAYEKTRIN